MNRIIRQFSGTVYPDYTFSLGRVPGESKKASDRQYDRDFNNQPEVNYGHLADWLIGTNTIEGGFCSVAESPLLVKGSKSSQEKRGSYGKHGITRFGKIFLKNACILLQRKYGRRRLGFLTATIPSVDKETCRTIVANWGDISRRFYQKIRRIYQKAGVEFIYVGCTEIQEKRFSSTNIPVPHLHSVYVSKRNTHCGYTMSTGEAYRAWNDSVNEVLVLRGKEPIMGTGGHKGSVKLESIRKSAASYIGKYVSKGCKVVEAMKEAGYEEFPKQWWTACMQAKKMFKDSLKHLSSHTCKEFFYDLGKYLQSGAILWASYIGVDIDGEERIMGMVGTLCKGAYELIDT